MDSNRTDLSTIDLITMIHPALPNGLAAVSRFAG